MSDEANLPGLGAAFRFAIDLINEAQGQVILTQIAATEAVGELSRTADGSNSDEIAEAIALVAGADEKLVEAATAYVRANEKIAAHIASRGL